MDMAQVNKIQILLHEYDTLREEILTRSSHGILLFVVAIVLFLWLILRDVLAYQFVQIIRRTLSRQGIKDSWLTLRTILEGQSRITASFKRADGRMLHVRKATQPEPKQKTIYRALRLDMTPGGIKKVAV